MQPRWWRRDWLTSGRDRLPRSWQACAVADSWFQLPWHCCSCGEACIDRAMLARTMSCFKGCHRIPQSTRYLFCHCLILFAVLLLCCAVALLCGVGLTMVVGPPGTGKTDTAVQILQVGVSTACNIHPLSSKLHVLRAMV